MGKETYRHVMRLLLFLLSASVFSAGAGRAENKKTGWTGEGRLTVLSRPEGAMVRIEGDTKVTARTPATITVPLDGNYLLEVSKRGYEGGRFTLSRGKAGSFALSGRRAAGLSRSLLLPGWGQFYNSRTGEGVLSILSAAVSAGGIYLAYDEYDDHRDRYRMFSRLRDAASNQEERSSYQETALKESRLANVSRDHVLVTTGILGYNHLYSVVETFLMSSTPRVNREGTGTFDFVLSERTGGKALARSLFFPGMGQKYLGNGVKGAVFQTAFLGVSLLAAEMWKEYEKASALYGLASERLAAASSLTGMEEARAEMEMRWDELRRKERARNGAFVAVGSVWLLNILDILTSGSGSRDGFPAMSLEVRAGPVYGMCLEF